MTATRTRTQFRPVAGQEGAFEVLERTGSRVVCLGRVARFGAEWGGLAVCAPAWTPIRRTRTEAVADMRAGVTFRTYR
jgi:hypothetical protein